MRTKTKAFWYRAAQFIQKDYDCILMFIGLQLLFYLSMNLVRSEILLKKVMEPQYLYQKAYFTEELWTSDQLDEASLLLEGSGVNCVMRWLYAGIGNSSDDAEALLYLSAEALAKKEKIDLAYWNETQNSVLIEGKAKPKSYVRGAERYILIAGLEFQVLDVIEEYEYMAYNVHVNWKNLDEEHRRIFVKYQKDVFEEYEMFFPGFPVQIQSLTMLKGKIDRFEESFTGKKHESGNYNDGKVVYRAFEFKKMKYFYLIMGIFVITGFYFLAELWFRRRRREYLIRRMLGSGGFRLWGISMRDAGIVTVLAFLGAAVIELVQMCMHIFGNVLWHEMLRTLVEAFLIAAGIESVLFVIYISRILEIYPTQGNIESAD